METTTTTTAPGRCPQCETTAPEGPWLPYAYRADGVGICYRCATDNERAAMAAAHADGRPFHVYGPSELRRGAAVTTWPGAHLARIVSVGTRPHPWTTRGRSFMGERYFAHMVDTDGRRWRGWLGEGLASTVRPVVAIMMAIMAIGGIVATAPDASATMAPESAPMATTTAEGQPANGGPVVGPIRIRATFGDRYAVPHDGPMCWDFNPRPRRVAIVVRQGARAYRGAPCRGPVSIRVMAPRSIMEDEVTVSVFGGRVHVELAPRPTPSAPGPTVPPTV